MSSPNICPKITLVLPCHNPADGWAAVAAERYAALVAARPAWGWSLVIVDDGSDRGMGETEHRALPVCTWIALPRNRGKSAALRAGLAAFESDYWIFTDVDFPFDDRSLLAVADRVIVQGGIVCGERRDTLRRGAPWSRRLLSALMRWSNRHVLRLPLADTQCGLKGMDRAGRSLFLSGREDGYAGDLEFVVRASADRRVSLQTVEVKWRGESPCGALKAPMLIREGGAWLRCAVRMPVGRRLAGLVPPAFAALVALAFLVCFYAPILRRPGEYLFGNGSDGLKNYFTAIWWVARDQGFWFSGMNYPFGEHPVFTDNQPALALTVRALRPAGVDPVRFTIGAINLAMLASLLLAAWFYCLILIRSGAKRNFAVAAAAALAVFSPQVVRMGAHYALSYACFVPLVWWLTQKFMEARRRAGWGVAIAATVFGFGFLHLYYLLMALVFLGGFAAAWALRRRVWRGPLALVTAVLVAALAANALMRLTDPVTDRPAQPWGLWNYNAHVGNLLFPFDDPDFVNWWDAHGWPHFRNHNGESHSFIGWAGWIGLGLLGWRLVRRRGARWRAAVPRTLGAAWWAGTLSLLMAFVYPVSPLLWVMHHLVPATRQFRSLARLEWGAWAVFSVAIALCAHAQARAWARRGRGGRAAAWALTLGMLGLWVWNASSRHAIYAHQLAEPGSRTANLLGARYGAPLRSAGAAPEEFQAVLGLPFAFAGSEKLGRGGSSEAETWRAALELGLPCANGSTSRTSLEQSLLIAQLAGDPLLPREIVAKYPAAKPLLLIVTEGPLDPGEASLVARATPLFQDGGVRVLRLPLARLQPELTPVRARWRELARGAASDRDWIAAEESALVRHQKFSAAPTAVPAAGVAPLAEENFELFAGELTAPDDGAAMEASVWLRPSPARAGVPECEIVVEEEPGRGQLTRGDSGHSLDTLHGWLLVRVPFSIPAGAHRVRVRLTGDGIFADEFLLRPAGLDVFTFAPDRRHVARNNVPFDPE